jgi:hypothetical protein
MSPRPVVVGRVQIGVVVVRRHRFLRTHGTVLRFHGTDENGAARVWVKWNHRNTLPNPSLVAVDDLELVRAEGVV